MKITFLLLIIFVSHNALCQEIKREDNETVTAFVERIKTDSAALAHDVIETNAWNKNQKAIVAFFGVDDTSDINIGFNYIYGHLFVPTQNNSYRHISFGPLMENGGYPEIISVFFANADKDAAKELIVMCKQDQQHYDYSGAFYETYIFDDPKEGDELSYLGELSDKFFGCECSRREGEATTAKFKRAEDVKAELKRMGFK